MNDRRFQPSIRLALPAIVVGMCGGCAAWASCCCWRSAAVPDRYPLGSVNRAHYQTMETNGEASDFILHRNEFAGGTTDLTPYGRDHVLEIAARAPGAPFPILVERSENNSEPELDEQRRALVARILVDCGVGDAPQRTIVSPAYGRGLTGREATTRF